MYCTILGLLPPAKNAVPSFVDSGMRISAGSFASFIHNFARTLPEACGAQKLCAGKNSGECTLLHCDLLTGRGREGKLANTTIDGEYNLPGQELPLSIMRLYLPPARADSTVV